MTIRQKIISAILILLTLGFTITGFTIIKIAKKSVKSEVSKQLETQVKIISDFIKQSDSVSEELADMTTASAEETLQREIDLLKDQIETILNAFEKTENNEKLIARAEKIILNKKIGESGYAYALDYEGTLAIHPKSKGKNLKGSSHIDEIIAKKSGIMKYMRQTDPKKPYVYAAYADIPRLNMVAVLTIKEAELLKNSKYIRSQLIERIKEELRSLKIGDTGYFYVMNSNADLIVHPSIEGENVAQYDFAQQIIKDKNGSISYDWQGEEKIAVFKTYPERDWIIVGGSYINEFLGATIKSLVISFAIISAIIIVITLLILNVIFNINVISPIKQLEKLFNKVAAGDLTDKMQYDKNDEIGVVVKHVDEMISQMSGALSKVKESSQLVSSSSQNLSASSDQMSKGITDQHDQIEQIVTAIDEMTHTINEMSSNIETSTNDVNIIRDISAEGEILLGETVAEIKNLSASVMESSDIVKKLGESSANISEIVQVISEIADQTNLLALNAAIEAARAGEHGRGFAVVADEVRKLAEKTVDATSEINNMVSEVQSGVTSSVEKMDHEVELAKKGTEKVEHLKSTIEQIISSIVAVADQISSIATAAEEQSATSREISENIISISAVSEQSSAISSSNMENANDLYTLAQELESLVNTFKLNK